jgi:hypothetical protein
VLSWWPTSIVWKENIKTTFWTEKSNKWFEKCLLELEHGQGKPLKPKEFRKMIRPGNTTRNIHTCVKNASEHFFDVISEGGI